MKEAREYIDELNTLDEHARIEAKQCTDKIDKSVLETICAYSNEPDLDGGTIVVGLQEEVDGDVRYRVAGVTDADKLQKDLASQCATMFNHPLRPQIHPDEVDGKIVLVVRVPELDAKYKPLYFIKEGLPRGAWRRVGSTDQRCTEEDLALFYTHADGFDKVMAPDTDLDDIDENAVRAYRRLREKVNPDAEELNYSDHDLLRSLKAIVKDKEGNWRLTNTGLLVFGKQAALRREMPSVRVDYIRVPGTEWISDPHRRFDSIDMRGPLLLLVGRAFNAVADDLPRGFSLSAGSLQADRPLGIPGDALREAIVNALVHQSLRVHRPIQIIRYSNRIEIINPGFSLKPIETLGEPGSELRNPTIGSIFHETQLAETKGTGIGTMRRLMKDASMIPPTFESDHTRNSFTTRILLHHFLSENDLRWFDTLGVDGLSEAQKVALVFVREVAAIDNITYRQLSGLSSKETAKEIKSLVNAGLLESKGQGRTTYYVPTEKLQSLIIRKNPSEDTNAPTSGPNAPTSDPNAPTSGPNAPTSGPNAPTCGSNAPTSGPNAPTPEASNDATSGSNDATSGSNDATPGSNDATPILNEPLSTTEEKELPEALQGRIHKMGKKVSKIEMQEIVVEICKVRPFSKEEIVKVLNRTESHVKTRILRPLLQAKRIRFTIPDMVNHPNQKYTAG